VSNKRTLDELLKSETDRQVERGADLERLRILDRSMGADLDAMLNAARRRPGKKERRSGRFFFRGCRRTYQDLSSASLEVGEAPKGR
jgi:hypothetical protein